MTLGEMALGEMTISPSNRSQSVTASGNENFACPEQPFH